MTTKRALTVIGRLPLLFVIDSICKGTFLNFTFDFFGIEESFLPTLDYSGPINKNLLYSLIFIGILFCVASMALVLVCSPINSVLESYGCVVGAILTWLSYNCNKRYINSHLAVSPTEILTPFDNSVESPSLPEQTPSSTALRAAISLLNQLFIMLGFDQICVTGILHKKRTLPLNVRYPIDAVLFSSFSLPIVFSSIFPKDSVLCAISPVLSSIIPCIVLLKYSIGVFTTIFYDTLLPAILYMKIGVRELGIDGLIMQVMEQANMGWLLRLFFFSQVLCQIVTSKTLEESYDLMDLNTVKILTLEILYNLCSTLISIMSLASIISILSGLCFSCVSKIIQGSEEEDSLQPVVSGFLFVLLAMQTGITSVSGDARLQLLFQNSILIVVANQHFVQGVAADLLIKASMDDSALAKHIRPLLPYAFFFTFPYFVVLPLWEYPFRLSWLLAITAFSIDLIIKSLTTLFIYVINMINAHTNLLGESTDIILFYTQALCGTLEFICGVFLFINGAFIFLFESGGFIRLFMMSVHFYCNIYQRAIKGWASYKLRISSWEKVNSLREAMQEELDDKEICSICYQEMTEAIALDCNHIFHKNCLQKWLSIQDTCPLCASKQQRQSSNVQEAPL